MIKISVIMAVLLACLLPALLLADDPEVTLQKGNKTIIIKGKNDLSDLKELQKLNIKLDMEAPKAEAADAPFFGIYPADLDFPKAQALNYPNSYGILITGIVPNSPAYQYRLAEDDIIMELDGKKALNLNEFDKLKSYYRAGDSVKIKLFRNGETKDVDFVFGSRTVPQVPSIPEIPKMQKRSVGSMGGSWIPMYYMADLDDVNEFVQALGFAGLPEDGILTHGFGGKGNIGKGWFLGGQFSFYSDMKKMSTPETDDDYIDYLSDDIFIGGATLDKRFALSRNVFSSVGLMIGGASHTINLIHTNGDYNWITEETDNVTDAIGFNSSGTISKGYILVQPRAELMVKLLSWLGLRGEVGYIYGYGPSKGWKVQHPNGEVYEMQNSPDTPFQGVTFSVGPWFGF